MRSIGTKFAVVVGSLAVIFSGIVAYRAWSTTRHHLEELTAVQAELAIEFDLALRDYVAQTIRPEMQRRIGQDEFVLEAMSSSYVARRVFEKIKRKFPDYFIKFSSENPRNPANQAGREEVRMIDYFRRHPEATRWSGKLRIDQREYLAYLSPMRIERACLRCHGQPQDCPRSLIERYGTAGGFGYRLGDVAGMDAIAIPLDGVRAALRRDAMGSIATGTIWLASLLVAILLAFRLVVTRRLAAITGHFRDATQAAQDEPLTPIHVEGADEIAVLAASFNSLAERLRALHESLEDRVRLRTAELRAVQQELVEKERLAALGQVTATMSHEIRNPLQTLRGSFFLVAQSVKEKDPSLSSTFDRIERSIERCDRIIDELADYAEAQELALQPTRIDVWLAALLDEQVLPEGVELVRDLDSGVQVAIDRKRLQRCVANVFVNACQAIAPDKDEERPDGQAPRIRVAAQVVDARLEIRVTDNGPGMTPEHLAKAFEPFYSTRAFGVGLGLPIVRRLMQLHHGGVQIQSTPGEGTTVVLWVPLESNGAEAPPQDGGPAPKP